MHTIEHFGLGRFGDKININGYKKGLNYLSKFLDAGGVLYLSTPIWMERVEYIANRIFAPNTIINLGKINNLKLERLSIVDDKNITIKKLIYQIIYRLKI